VTFISVDMTTTDPQTDAILQSFGVVGAPTTLFFGSDGKEKVRRVGFIGPKEFAELLTEARSVSDRLEPPHRRAPNPGV
jgi:thiol:disulfide interchange protein